MICKKCGNETPRNRFATFRQRDGSIGRRGECWNCRNKYYTDNAEKMKAYRVEYNKRTRPKRDLDQESRRKIAKDYINSAKDVPCADCGKKWPPVAMDFDHVRGDKIKSISSYVSGAYKLELIKEEIAKCEVVCACCHRIRTASRGENKTAPTKDPFLWILEEINSNPVKTFQANDFQGREQSAGKNKLWCNQALISLFHQGRIDKAGRGKYRAKILESN